MEIRPSRPEDLPAIEAIHRSAFPEEDVAGITRRLLHDSSARPLVSLLAIAETGEATGHVLLSAATLREHPDARCHLLAPLGVTPDSQRSGVGSALMQRALVAAEDLGVALVLLLGHPDYYPRFGFVPAAPRVEPPYPIPEAHLNAWMLAELPSGRGLRGRLQVAEPWRDPKLWPDHDSGPTSKAPAGLEVKLAGDREVVFRRLFAAPPDLVFDCFTKPDLVRRWLSGPPPWRMVQCEIDLRPEGKFRYVWGRPGQAERMGLTGTFREIAPAQRIVHTEIFDEDWTGGETHCTTLFLKSTEQTEMQLTVRYSSAAATVGKAHSDVLQGMSDGLAHSYDALARLLAQGVQE